MKKILLLSLFFVLTPITLIFSLLFLSFIYRQGSNVLFSLNQTPKVAYAALPSGGHETILNPEVVDARVSSIQDFLSFHKSPLLPYSAEIVKAADKYDIDYRLIPAIAMQESTLCKNLPKKYKDTHNCWGFGIYGKKVTSFDSFSQAIDVVTKTLATQYIAKGLKTPEELMSKYNPVSVNGSWAKWIAVYMDRLDYKENNL